MCSTDAIFLPEYFGILTQVLESVNVEPTDAVV